MKFRMFYIFAVLSICFTHSYAQLENYPTYAEVHGKEDRISFQEDKIFQYFNGNTEQKEHIFKNMSFMDCGRDDEPASAFMLNTTTISKSTNLCPNQIVVTAGHNLYKAKHIRDRVCSVYHENTETGYVLQPYISKYMKIDETFDNKRQIGIKDYAGDFGFISPLAKYSYNSGPLSSHSDGFHLCSQPEIDEMACMVGEASKMVLSQSSSTDVGKFVVSPKCCIMGSTKSDVLSTSCKGYINSSGAPLLNIQNGKTCVVGIYVSDNGKVGSEYKFSSGAVSVTSDRFINGLKAFAGTCPITN